MNCPHCQAPLVADARFCPACGKANAPTDSGNAWMAASAAPDLVGREIAGRYRIAKKLGEGGMGAVYRGEQMSLKRQIAVKLLRPELGTNQMILQRFNAEAQAVAKLSHPNTVNIYDFGQDSDGTLFIAMEYIEGRSLREAIQQDGAFSVQRALAVALQVAASLSDAHSHSIVHRDLKPDNVMLQSRGKQKDVVRVLDFGIAKLRDDNRATQQAAMTQAGDMLGTPQYMAPEQIKGEAIDGRTDVYALGCMIYEMVTARLPYEATSIMAMLSKHLVEDVIPPSQRRPDLNLPPGLDALVVQAMAKEPNDRAPTMEAFAEQIGALFGQLPPDPNAPQNRSGAMSMQQVAVGAALTPAAFSAFKPPTPPPGGAAFVPPGPPGAAAFVPPVPPPFAPPGPPPTGAYVAPSPSGRGAAPPAAPTTHVIAASPPNRTALYAVLALLVLGGAGIGGWFAMKGDDKPKASAGSGAPVGDPDTDPDPDTDTPPPIPTPTPTPTTGDDPWAPKDEPATGATNVPAPKPAPPVKAEDIHVPDVVDVDEETAADVPAPTAVAGTAYMKIPRGATIVQPAGFTLATQTDELIAYKNDNGAAVVMVPLYPGSNDPVVLARKYEQENHATLVSRESIPSAGGQRPMLMFTSTENGVQYAQFAVLYISDHYRLAVVAGAPLAVVQDDAFGPALLEFFTNNVKLP